MPLKLLPPPEPDEVVTAIGQQLQIGVEVEPFRVFGAVVARTQPVVKVVVDMRAGEIDRPFRSLRCREIPGVVARDDERTKRLGHSGILLVRRHPE
jgi:hypothetical protein